ncbi:hypothetical protein BKA70DRAFT_1499984 [Coprinopsis sp. MPI-PUGE-AT-0042]|nr:hypothetical protein BKA70DRAFT_1499984 [Coprinopsis sp. MPI-PUGE-AT-0042]
MSQDHDDILSAISTTVRKIERQLESLSGRVTINGATFTTAGRDICNYITYSFCPSTNLHPGPQFPPPAGVYVGSRTCKPSFTNSPFVNADQTTASASEPIAPFAGSVPLRFEGLAVSLQTVAHQVQPHSGDVLSEVQCILLNLRDLIAFSSTIYNDLSSTALGDRVRGAIDARIAECTRTLLCTHRQLDGLVYRRLPFIGRLYHRLFGRWWCQWEPRKIATIREALSLETKHFAEWLSFLRSQVQIRFSVLSSLTTHVRFFWAKHLIMNPQSRFEWSTLNYFLKNRFRMVKNIHVKQITVIDRASPGGTPYHTSAVY